MSDLINWLRDRLELDPSLPVRPAVERALREHDQLAHDNRQQQATIERLTEERDRFKEQHKLCLDEIEKLRRELEAAAALLTNGRLIEWGWNSELSKHGYYLRNDWAGTTMLDVITKAAEQKEGE